MQEMNDSLLFVATMN
ncbi:unnamed protein product [Acanthoscelides obtectus]|uniref:Uncharacterized protein n=1 Tax=Acanthoscelides obtectus TaxID=200917 RepID=A0A9P0LLE7_ACAOB|nr:unnamed protein product [Acanthoscelides obtectus]